MNEEKMREESEPENAYRWNEPGIQVVHALLCTSTNVPPYELACKIKDALSTPQRPAEAEAVGLTARMAEMMEQLIACHEDDSCPAVACSNELLAEYKATQARPDAEEEALNDPIKLSDDEEDAVMLWAEIHRLRAALQGPEGYATWQQAATAERMRRVKAERSLAATQARPAEAEPVGLTGTVHDLKILPDYFEAVADGRKTFEVRRTDRKFCVGDTLRLREWTGGEYTGRECTRQVTYVLSNTAWVPEGCAILALATQARPDAEDAEHARIGRSLLGYIAREEAKPRPNRQTLHLLRCIEQDNRGLAAMASDAGERT